MEELSKDEIICVFDTDDSTPIFDKDDWASEALNIDASREISFEKNTNANNKLIQKVNQEIELTKQHFFNVKVCKKALHKSPINNKNSSNFALKLPFINENNKSNILFEGYMNKKTDGFIFKWHKRYLVLTAQKLYFFTCDKKIEVSACVNLRLLPTEIKEAEGQLILDFDGQCENIILKPQNEDDKKKWKSLLEKVIQYQAKQNKVMIKTLVKPLYDSKDTISEKQFIQSAETGDILLFYTKNTGAQLQRIFTNSEYDHVAMVIKFRKNDLMVFESNQIYGVSIYDWRQYLEFFDLYQKISLRKLQYIKKADVQREILNFVKKNLGKSYEISLSKLVAMQSEVNWDLINKEKKKDRGYFCSQLIAKALKSVGLLDEKKSSGRYWPVDFAEKSGMMLRRGAYLGKEQVILLNKHLKNYI